MERKGSDFQERLLAKQDKKKKAYFDIGEGDVTSIKQSVYQFYKALERDDSLGVTLNIKTAVSKLHSMLNQDQEEFLTSDIDERHRHQLAAPFDERTVSATIQDLTMAVQEDDMDAITLHIDMIMSGLQSMIATVQQHALEADVVDSADL